MMNSSRFLPSVTLLYRSLSGFSSNFGSAHRFCTAISNSESQAQELPDGLFLVQLPTRTWGPVSKLSAEIVSKLLGKNRPESIGVVRDAFAPFDAAPRQLSQLVRCLDNDIVVVASELTLPHKRMLVDEYKVEESGEAVLANTSHDLVDFLNEAEAVLVMVPDVTASSLTEQLAVAGATRGLTQCTSEVLMMAPTAFGFNAQAAEDNSFMNQGAAEGEGEGLTRTVLKEFAGLHHALVERAGVSVHLFEHNLEHGTPDAVFPNNWFSTHQEGEGGGGLKENTLVLYPMKCPNRAAERRPQIIDVLNHMGYQATYDMTQAEAAKKYFEGTGVLVLDRVNGVAYVDISERADPELAQQWVDRMGYKKLVTFRSTDLRSKPVYHTNVMMAIGTGVAIVCAESVADEKERQHLLESLKTHHEVVEINLKQMDALCGNALELLGGKGLPVMAMSTQAYNAFTEDQRRVMRRHVVDIVHAPIDTLERVGGGGVRCTLAELF